MHFRLAAVAVDQHGPLAGLRDGHGEVRRQRGLAVGDIRAGHLDDLVADALAVEVQCGPDAAVRLGGDRVGLVVNDDHRVHVRLGGGRRLFRGLVRVEERDVADDRQPEPATDFRRGAEALVRQLCEVGEADAGRQAEDRRQREDLQRVGRDLPAEPRRVDQPGFIAAGSRFFRQLQLLHALHELLEQLPARLDIFFELLFGELKCRQVDGLLLFFQDLPFVGPQDFPLALDFRFHRGQDDFHSVHLYGGFRAFRRRRNLRAVTAQPEAGSPAVEFSNQVNLVC